MSKEITMVDYLVWAMEGRGQMSNSEIYKRVLEQCKKLGRSTPENFDAEVRETLQAHCSSSPQFAGKRDLFEHHKRGYWSCKIKQRDLKDLL